MSVAHAVSSSHNAVGYSYLWRSSNNKRDISDSFPDKMEHIPLEDENWTWKGAGARDDESKAFTDDVVSMSRLFPR